MKDHDRGMTLIEVSIALVILLLGVGFILKSDSVSHRYLYERQLRQQMLFYAAGQLEAVIEGKEDIIDKVTVPPFSQFQVTLTKTPMLSSELSSGNQVQNVSYQQFNEDKDDDQDKDDDKDKDKDKDHDHDEDHDDGEEDDQDEPNPIPSILEKVTVTVTLKDNSLQGIEPVEIVTYRVRAGVSP